MATTTTALLLAVLPCVLILYSAYLNWKGYRNLPRCHDWKSVGNSLDYTDVQDAVQNFPKLRNYLETVLTDRHGHVRPGSVHRSLDLFAAEIDHFSRAFRSLSGLAVLCGLGITAIFLAWSLRSASEGSILNPTTLKNVYVPNAICICVALLLLWLNYLSRQNAEKAYLEATRVLSRLQEIDPENVDPRLIQALQTVASKFREWGQSFYSEHFGAIQSILNEMQGLSTQVRNYLLQALNEAQQSGQEIQLLLRELQRGAERVRVSLDEGFKLLAQPFIQGVPASREVLEAAETLKKTIAGLQELRWDTSLQDFAKEVAELRSAIDTLPDQVCSSLAGVKDSISSSTRSAIHESLMPAVHAIHEANLPDAAQRIVEGMDLLKKTLSEIPNVFRENLDGLLPVIASGVRQAVQDSISPAFQELAELRISESAAQMTASMQNLTETMVTFPERIQQGFSGVKEQFTEGAGRALKESLAPAVQDLVQADVSGSVRMLNETVRQWNDVYGRTIEDLTKVVQSFENSVNPLVARLDNTLSQLVRTLQDAREGLVQTLPSNMSKILIEIDGVGEKISNSILKSSAGLAEKMHGATALCLLGGEAEEAERKLRKILIDVAGELFERIPNIDQQKYPAAEAGKQRFIDRILGR